MKRLAVTLTLALVLAGASVGAMSSASQAQVFVPVQPVQTVVTPWAGPNTPWVFYNGDWFLNGILYYFFGNNIGWAPYYAYPPTYIVRPNYWYAPRWHTWYQEHPTYWRIFQRRYPYWHSHQVGQHYNQAFYDKYHHGQGGGWHKGFHAGPQKSLPPAGHKPYPANVGHGNGPRPGMQPGQFQPGPTQQGHQGHYLPGPTPQGQKGQYQPGPTPKGQPGHYQPGTTSQGHQGRYQAGQPQPVQPQPGQKGHYQPGQPAHGQQKPERESPKHQGPPE